MSSKTLLRLKYLLYGLLLILAELLQTSVFGTLQLGFVPCVMPVAVACISMFEGAETGCLFGLIGGCLWAWSTNLSYYGAWCIVILPVIGLLAGLITERFLLRGVQTALCFSAGALLLTDGLYAIAGVLSGVMPGRALFTIALPGGVAALALCLLLYPLTASISRIGGYHG